MLPDLMNRLLAIVMGVVPVRAKELAVSCIGAVAVAVEVRKSRLKTYSTNAVS